MAIVFARGLRINRDEINKFLLSYEVHPFEGDRISDTEEQAIADVFRGSGIDWEFRILTPSVDPRSHDEPNTAALEGLRQLLGAEHPVASHVLNCPNILWKFPELVDRARPPISCDACNEVFTADGRQAWWYRQKHRREVHGSTEGDSPLPDDY